MTVTEEERFTVTGRRGRTRREALTAERAKQILDAAVEVFARRGYERATTKEIAAAAGVAEGTIYNYYRSKRALLFAMVKRLATETLPVLFEEPVPDEQERMRAIVRDRLEAADRARPVAMVIFQQLVVDDELRREYFTQLIAPLIGRASAFLQQRIAVGDFRLLNPRVALPGVIGAVMLNALAFEMSRQFDVPLPGPALDRDQLIDNLVDFILYGLAGQPRPTATSGED